MYDMKHSDSDVKLIMDYVNNESDDITIKELALFIFKTLGTKWNTIDKETVAYLQEFLDNKKLNNY